VTAWRWLLAATNLEQAQQFRAAVGYYLEALRTGSQSIPVEKIGEKLAAIRQAHPAEYEAGAKEKAGALPEVQAVLREKNEEESNP
jgi:hypothetical protein